MPKRLIYEIARELGIPSRDVVERAQSLGMRVTTASSGLDAGALARVVASYRIDIAPSSSPPSPVEIDEETSQTSSEIAPVAAADSSDVAGPVTSINTHAAVGEFGISPFPLPSHDDDYAAESEGIEDFAEASALDPPDRISTVIAIVAVLIVAANTIRWLSAGIGVVVHGVTLAIAVGFIIFGATAVDREELSATSWIVAALALVPTIGLGLTAGQSISSWIFPVAFVIPVGLGASWIVMLLPDRGVTGLSLADKHDLFWSLAVVPLVAILMVSSFGESNLYFGSTGGETDLGRLAVLLAAALVIQVVYYGLIQGLAEPLVGRAVVPWIAVIFAGTFAASWAGFAVLLVLGLVLGTLRTRFESIWPGFVATALVLLSLATL